MGQLLEPRQTVRPEHNRLAVNREALGFDLLGSRRIASGRTVQPYALRL
jgi:hypothetical protein